MTPEKLLSSGAVCPNGDVLADSILVIAVRHNVYDPGNPALHRIADRLEASGSMQLLTGCINEDERLPRQADRGLLRKLRPIHLVDCAWHGPGQRLHARSFANP